MRLLKLNISNFGLFYNKKLEFSEGLNLIYGKNEAGKSTIHGFIKGMLFGIKKSRGRPSAKDMYVKYQPWNSPGSFDGSMEFKAKDNTYHIYRNFNKDNRETILTQLETGRELEYSNKDFQELINGITRAAYDGTISIDQLNAKTNDQLVYVIQNHITNLTLTKSEEIDIEQALEYLDKKRRNKDIKSLEEEIQGLRHIISEGKETQGRIDEISREIAKLQTEEEGLLRQRDALTNNGYYTKKDLENLFSDFPVIRTKYGYYLERLDESKQIKKEIISKKEEIDEKKSKNEINLKAIKSDLDELDQYKSEHSKNQPYLDRYEGQDMGVLSASLRRNLLITCIFILTGLISAFSFFSINNILSTLGAALSIIASGSFYFSYKSYKEKKKKYEAGYVNLKEGQTSLEQKAKDILRKYNLESDIELRSMYEQRLKDQEALGRLVEEIKASKDRYLLLQDRIRALKEELLDYLNKFYYIYNDDSQVYSDGLQENLKLSDSAIGRLEEYITDEQVKLNKYEEDIRPKLDELSSTRDKLMWELERLEEKEEELEGKQEGLDQLLKKQEEAKEEIESINLAKETIEGLSINIHDTFGAELNKIASSLAKEITNGIYEEIKIDENLNIKTEASGQYQFLEKFSTGTIEQLYLSLRLAIADLVYGKGKVPILLDDTFAYYDDDRIRSTLEMLLGDSERQILLFTCHNREKEILDELNASYNYIEL